MLVLPLTKNNHPDFMFPRKKPVSEVDLDLGHPLTRGLKYYNMLDAMSNKNLAKNKERLTVGGNPTLDITQGGRNIALDGTGDYLQSGHNYNNANRISLALSFKLPSGADNAQFDRVFELGGFATDDGGIGIQISSVTTEIVGVIWSLASPKFVPQATVADKIHNLVITSDASTGENKFYFDGILIDTITTTRLTLATQFTLGGRNNSPTLNSAECTVSNLGIWQDRILSLADVQILHKSPYAMLKPRDNVLYFPAADVDDAVGGIMTSLLGVG